MGLGLGRPERADIDGRVGCRSDQDSQWTHAYAYPVSYGYAYLYFYSHCHAYVHANPDTDGHADASAHQHTFAYINLNSNPDPNGYADTTPAFAGAYLRTYAHLHFCTATD